jgi:uracil-DNA glycosylase family 4
VSGEGRKGILFVADFPDIDEDKSGVPFSGKGAQYLRKVLRELGIDLQRDCWVTYALVCRPPKGKMKDSKQLEYCRPNVVNTVHKLQPRIIIPLGQQAVSSLLGWLWKEDVGTVTRWVGWQIPSHKVGSWICPNWSPAALVRGAELDGGESTGNDVMEVLFRKYLERSLSLGALPPVVDYAAQVEVLYDPQQAAKVLRQMIKRGGRVAFDYETNMLKPDSKGAAIVSCSVCWEGRRTIAYPWLPPAIEATRELIRSPLKKIASNMKFEDRWTRRILDTPVRNWHWDTMLAAHILDNRPGVTGLKFQAFVLLGAPSYDEHIKQYLRGPGTNELNRIAEVSLADLLKYNGLDSLLEFRVMQKQQAQMGVPSCSL